MGIDALIPFKALDQAKSRLAGALQPADRRDAGPLDGRTRG